MTRAVTLAGFAAIAACVLVLEVAGRRSGHISSFGAVLSTLLRTWPVRGFMQAGWLWLGWHLFVRTDW